MLKTFNVELTSLVNSDPAWKVPKGSRSVSRQARRTVRESLKNCAGLINRDSESSSMPVSGSDKRGASMVDCRFSEKAEHVPLKKRRFIFRASPSPPPPPPPVISHEETESQSKGNHASNKHTDMESSASELNSSKITDDNTFSVEDKKSEEASKSFGEGEGEDFSGISILAAAACSSSLSRDCSDTEDGSGVKESSAQESAHEVHPITETDLSTSTVLKEDLPDSSEKPTVSCVGSEIVGQPASISTIVDSSQDVTAAKDAMEPSSVSCDVSCSSADEERAGSQKQSCRDGRFHWDLNVMMDAWEVPFEEQNDVPSNTSQDGGKDSHDTNMENSEVRDLQFKLATSCAAEDSALPGGEPRTSANHSSEDDKLNLDISLDEKPLLSDCNKNHDTVSEDSKFVSHNRVAKPTDGSVDPVLNPAYHPSASGTVNEHSKGMAELEDSNLSTSGAYCALEDVKSSFAADNVQPSLCVEGPNSASTKCAAPTGAKEQDFSGYKGEKLEFTDTSSFSKETCDKSSSYLGEANAAEAPNQDSDAKIVLQKGYDCQYEDGELREATNEHLWDGSDVVDREVEYVDYESDDMGPCTINPAGYLVSGSGETMERDNNGPQETAVVSSRVGEVAIGLAEDYVSHEEESRVKSHPKCEEKLKESVSKEPLAGRSSSSDMDIAVSDDEGQKGRLASHANGLVDSNCAEKARVEPKPFRRNLQSRIGGSAAHDMSSREERLNRMESRYEESSSTRSFERPRYYFQNQGRGRQGDSWDGFPDNRRGVRRQYSPVMNRLSRFQSSLKYRRPLSNRERSLSPPFGGRMHPSRGKSPSQSRSRSPIMWNHSPRGRSGSSFVRHRSRSPNFGSEVRVHQRLRSTHHQQQPGFGPCDGGGGFRSIPRNRGSPPQHGNHFREFSYNQRPGGGGLERSPPPGRIRMRGDRAGIYDPPRNLKYNRISEESSSRDHLRYDDEGYDGRRKHYGPNLRPPIRHNNSSYEDSSMDGRLQQHQDMNDSFSMPKGVRDRDGSDFPGRGLRGSSMENRMSDLPRRFRGEHSYVCEQEGQYRSSSSRGGRFGNMNGGVNRVRRYDYFDNNNNHNRRKQYDPPSFMKRNGDSGDGSEKRLNRNLDENFQGGSEFCGRTPMRSFEGRLSTRLREEIDSTGCGQERKLEDNPQ